MLLEVLLFPLSLEVFDKRPYFFICKKQKLFRSIQCLLIAYLTPLSRVSTLNFEQVDARWVLFEQVEACWVLFEQVDAY